MFDGLPPLKRFRLMQQQAEQSNKNPESTEISAAPTCLPAKKRKGLPAPPPMSAPSTTLCLPAKKRILAVHPFDLNLDYEPSGADRQEPPLPEIKESPETDTQPDGAEKPHPEDPKEDGEEDGIVCSVCGSTDGDPVDPIVLCDGCDLMAHTTCYGDPFTNGIPDGDWFCAQCLELKKSAKGPKAELSCCLCPADGGAMKPTTDGRWAHLVCAIYVPEVFFEDPVGRRGIDCSKVLKKRWEGKCYVCKSTSGCVVDCSEPKCPFAFHVSCGLKEELWFEYWQGKSRGAVVAAFCRSHTDLWKKQEQTGKFKIVARDDKEK
ncbi:RING/FYVE/PHD zinc finger superfamily protein [Striga hermonthica]|uniref:RING/FYVE/PHD zinc finger superfamily protein n=1 Tax=Striga hermonthica TaxID=68872 RepID=A0A9N7R2Z4_STRHE|nr:RING/FYVE/PHD zinc finger superfamily protein [Striga hermonthica]